MAGGGNPIPCFDFLFVRVFSFFEMQTCHVTTMGSPKSPGSVTIAIRYTSSPLQPRPPSRSGLVDSAENEPICWAKVGGENGAGEPPAAKYLVFCAHIYIYIYTHTPFQNIPAVMFSIKPVLPRKARIGCLKISFWKLPCYTKQLTT